MNPPGANDNQLDWISARQAMQLLSVKAQTLYAYVSRGHVRSIEAGSGARARLYLRADVERMRTRAEARAGHAPVAAAALRWGEPVLDTAIGTVDARGPIYRGTAATDLIAAGAHFEDVCALLWTAPTSAAALSPTPATGAEPTPRAARPRAEAGSRGARSRGESESRAAGSRAESGSRGARGFDVGALVGAVPRGARAFEAMLFATGAFAAAGPVQSRRVLDYPPGSNGVRDGSPTGFEPADAMSLLRRIVAAAALPRGVRAVRLAINATTVARCFLLAIGGKATLPRAETIVDKALVLCADHELNVSTFATRVAASTDASLASSVLAGMAALSGPRHGAATAMVERLVDEIALPERAAAVVAAYRERGEAVPGFGHPLYPTGDPRGALLLAEAVNLAPRAKGVRVLVALTNAMRLATREHPTLDVGLVAVAAALGLPAGSALALFAAGRLAGWPAHALEQRAAGHLLRPRARYIGA